VARSTPSPWVVDRNFNYRVLTAIALHQLGFQRTPLDVAPDDVFGDAQPLGGLFDRHAPGAKPCCEAMYIT